MLSESTNGRLNVATGPENGPRLVMLHGVCRRWQDFVPVIPSLAGRWRLELVDFRGHGGSERGSAYRVVDYVDDAVEQLRAAQRPVVIYGHSLGAMVALAAAVRATDSVRALVLEDPPFETLGAAIRRTPFFAQFAGVQRILTDGTPAEQLPAALASIEVPAPDGRGAVRLGELRDAVSLRFMAWCLEAFDPRALVPLVEGHWMDGYDLEAIARRVRCPTLLLQANPARGGMLSVETAARLAAVLPDCTLVERPEAGHLIHWQDTEATLRIVQAFLETVRVG